MGSNALLSSNKKKRSWFLHLRELAHQYCLPDPLQILSDPLSKPAWKKLCKAKVLSWWEEKLRNDVRNLSSLTYFKPEFMSLDRIHPLWSTAETPYEVKKAAVVADMLSGRYVTDYRARHWSKKNPDGFCQLCLIQKYPATVGTLEHILRQCPALTDSRSASLSLWTEYISDKPEIASLVNSYLDETIPTLEFLLDPSTCPEAIRMAQSLGPGLFIHAFYLIRTWCYSQHLKLRKLQKLYNLI